MQSIPEIGDEFTFGSGVYVAAGREILDGNEGIMPRLTPEDQTEPHA